jgi:LCP family protein required for cell wall assembly
MFMKVYDISGSQQQPTRQQKTSTFQKTVPKVAAKRQVSIVKPKAILGVIILLFLFAAFGAYAYISNSLSHTKKSFANGQGISLATFAAAENTTLSGENDGRTNVMIYGLTADGLRTDTIILASYYWNEHKLVMLNIPRDLYASYNGNDTKIVSLYSIAKDANPTDQSYPPQYVSDFISKEYGINIDYWVVANMNAFKQLVDAVGGVSINVPDSFTDYQYPTDDYKGYIRPAPHFDAGIQTMDGTTALIYARSRHAAGPEGTDFARSKRQQVIIEAILSKLKQQGVFNDISKLDSYLNIFGDNIFTNMTPADLIKSAKVASEFNLSQDIMMANWSNDIGFLCDSTDAGGSYVLRYGVPGDCTGMAGVNDGSSYRQEAINYVQNLLQSAEPKIASSSPSATQAVSTP